MGLTGDLNLKDLFRDLGTDTGAADASGQTPTETKVQITATAGNDIKQIYNNLATSVEQLNNSIGILDTDIKNYKSENASIASNLRHFNQQTELLTKYQEKIIKLGQMQNIQNDNSNSFEAEEKNKVEKNLSDAQGVIPRIIDTFNTKSISKVKLEDVQKVLKQANSDKTADNETVKIINQFHKENNKYLQDLNQQRKEMSEVVTQVALNASREKEGKVPQLSSEEYNKVTSILDQTTNTIIQANKNIDNIYKTLGEKYNIGEIPQLLGGIKQDTYKNSFSEVYKSMLDYTPEAFHLTQKSMNFQPWIDSVVSGGFSIGEREINKETGKKLHSILDTKVKETKGILKSFNDLFNRILEGTAYVPTDTQELNTMVQKLFTMYQILIDNSAFIQEFMKQTDSVTIGNKKYQEQKKEYINNNIASVEFDSINQDIGTMLNKFVTTLGFDSPLNGEPDKYISSYLSQERENIKLLVVQSILETIGTKELGTVLESYLPKSAEVLNYIQDKQKSNIQNSNNPIYFRLLGETPFASKKEYPTSLRPYNRKPVDATPIEYNLIPDKIDTTKYDFQQSIPSFFNALNNFVDGIRPFVNGNITDFSEEFKTTLTNNLLSGEKISEQKLPQGESLSVILKRLEAVISILERLVTQGAIDRTNPKKPETLNFFEDNNIFTLMENMKQAPSFKQVSYIFRVIYLFYEFFEDLYDQCATDVKQLQNIDTALASVRPKGEGISDTKENLEQLCGRLDGYVEYYQRYLDDNGIGISTVVRESESYNRKTSRVSKNRIHSSESTYTNNINGIVTQDTKVLNPFYTSQDNIITVHYKEIEDDNNTENDRAETLKQNTQSLEDLKNAITNNFEDINKENTSSNAEASPDSDEDTDETNLEEIAKNTTEISEKLQNIDTSTAKDSDNQPSSEKPNSDNGIPDNNIGSGQGGSNNSNNGGNNGGNNPPPSPPTPPNTPPNNSDLNAIEDDLLRKLVEKSMRDFAEVYNKGIKEDVKFNLKTSKTYGDEDTEDKNEIVLTLKLDNGLKQTLQYDVTSSDTGEKVFNLTNNTVTNTKYGDERDKQNNKLSSILTQVYKKKVDYLGGKDINNNDYQGKKYITDGIVRADFETRISTLEQYINDLTNKDQIDTNKLNEEIRILDTTVKSLFDDMDKAYKAQDKIGNVEQNTLNAQISEVEKATKEVDGIKDKVDTILKEVDKKNAEVDKLLKDAENSKSEVEKNSADKIKGLIDKKNGQDNTYRGTITDIQNGKKSPQSFPLENLQTLLEQADLKKSEIENLNNTQKELIKQLNETTDDNIKQQLKQEYETNRIYIDECKKQYIEYTEEYVRRGKQIISIEEQVGNAIAETNEQHKQETIIASSQKKITNLKGRLDRLMYNNSKAFTNADYQADADKIYALLNSYQSNADYLDKTKINAAEQQLAKLNLRIQQNNVSGKSLGKTLNELWGRWSGTAMVGMAFRKGLQFIHQMWNAVKEVDKAMTELRKVTDEVGSTYDRYLRTAGATAKELGVSLSDIVNSTADFARLGYSLTESADLSKVATVYKNVADGIDIGTATGDIVSAMKAFSISAEDAMSVADMYNEVGNNFAISSAGIGQALTRSAASLQAAGNSLSESIALVTAGNEILQDPETMGTALKVISLRIRGASADLEDMGESTDDLCDSTSKLRAEIKALSGVDIMLDEETFKSTYQILKEISAVYNDLTGVSQAALTEKLAGKTRSNALQAILTNFDTAEKAYQTAENSAGSAMRENEKYLDSIAGKMAKISASFQELSNAVLDADWVKPLLDGINNILDGVSNLFKTEWGDYNPFNILTVGASLALGTVEATTDGLGILTVKGKTASEQLENLFNPKKHRWSLDILGTTLLGSQNFNANKLIDKNFLVSGDKKFTDSFKDLQNIFTNYSKINNDLDFSKLTEGTEAYNVCLNQLVDTFPDLKEESAGALIEIIKSNDTLITGTGKAEDNQKALSAAIRRTNADLVGTAIEARAASVAMAALKTIGSMAIGFALGAAVSLISKGISDAIHRIENAEDRLAETVEKWNQASKSLSEKKNTFSNGNIAEEFVELSKGVSNTGRNIALTSDEYDRYIELSKQLYDLNPQLTHTFDEQGNILLTFKGNVEQLNKVVNDYFDTLKDENNRKILQEQKTTFKDLNNIIAPKSQGFGIVPLNKGEQLTALKQLMQISPEDFYAWEEAVMAGPWESGHFFDYLEYVPNLNLDTPLLTEDLTTTTKLGHSSQAQVIIDDLNSSNSAIKEYYNSLLKEVNEQFVSKYKPVITATIELDEDFKGFSEETKSAIYQTLDNIDYEFAVDFFFDEKNGTIDFEGMAEWATEVVQAFNDNPEISQAIAKSLDIDTKYQNGEISTEEYTNAIAEIGKTFESVDDIKTRSLLIDTAGYEEQANKTEEAISTILNKFSESDKFAKYDDKGFKLYNEELESFLNSLSKQELEIVYSIINDPESEYESLDALKQELEVIKREKVVISVEVKTNENNFETDYKAYTEKAKEAYDKFDNAIATVSAGNAISLEDMMSLTNLDSSLLGQFTKTTDGYVIATDSLTSAREKYLKTLETEVRLNKAAAEATQTKLEADLEVLKEEATFAENYFIAVNTTNSSDGAKKDALKDFQEKIKAVKAIEEEIAKNNTVIAKYGILLNDITDPVNKSATAINNLNTALNRLNSTYNTVNNAKIDVATFGHITASNLQSLADTYPELKDDIAEYLASSMSEADNAKLIQAAERAYQKTRDDLKTFFEKELFDSEETYNSWLTNNEEMLGEWLDNNKDIYKADFKNYKTFQELKKALDTETANDGKYITRTNTQGELEKYNLSLNDLVDDKGNVTSLYLDLVTHLNPKDENDAQLLQWIKNIVNGYQELKIGVALEGEANETIDNIEDDHVLSTNPDIEAYKLQLAELEHRQNMGEDVLDELDAKLAEGVQIYSKHKDQFLSDYNSTLERLHNMTNEFYNRDKSIIDHQLEMGEISHREYYNQLTQLYEKYYKGKADFQKEDWQLQAELEKERISLISEEQSLLQKQKDEIIKYETDAYDTQIKLLQSKIDKNKKISDELSEQNNLLEAQKALLEASQRTKYVYRQGQGFVYERDEEAYYNAKTKYAETLRDIENNALQKKIDALQEASEQSVTIIENFFNNLNDILEEQINPEKANDIGVWSEFFSEDQISALEAILGKKDELKDMYDKGRTVDYNGETYRYIDDDAIARLAENYMPVFMKAYQTELEKTMKLTDTDTLAKTKGFNNTVNKTSYGNSLNQINVQKDAIQIMIQGKVDSQTITDLRNSVYQALDDLVDRMELKATQERGKQ